MLKRVSLIILTLLLIGIPFTLAIAQASSPATHVGEANTLPSPTPSALMEEAAPSGPPLSLTLSLLCFCLVFSLVIGVFVLGVIVRMPSREDKEKYKEKEDHGI